ncbi:MAG: sulfur carrier protein ThiS [Nitrospiraceae bacterium]|nr:MAG: sulfur carrier protein ThiS [bacterium]UCF87574.1 MAG: sulfur carrier protein ThiS [Nitrospiraceae bacterium]
MKLTLNGNISEFQNVTTVADLLQNLQIEPLRVAVEVNLAIIKKPDYGKCQLKEGDSVEIVNFVGGG